MKKNGRDFPRKQRLDISRTRTMSENDSLYGVERISSKKWTLEVKQKASTSCSDKTNVNEEPVVDAEEETFRDLILRHSDLSKRDGEFKDAGAQCVENPRRPMLERKSQSDLTSYCNTKIKILVEGKELSNTDAQEKYSLKGFNSALQEISINMDHISVTETQREQTDKTKLQSLVGWLGKSHAKSYDFKNDRRNLKETSEKCSPNLKRSRSFSGRIRDKIKLSFTSTKQPEVFQPQKSPFLQPPRIFYKNVDFNRLNSAGVTQFAYQRRHSDQTDSMSRRPLGGRRDVKISYYSLDRGLRQISAKKPLTRKRSNSFEKQDDDFPFWAQISDANRSHSCAGRIRVTKQLDTHRDNYGTLETNLCSTEL